MRFRNRVEAGQRLANRLQSFDGEATVVLGLPRGGVPIAREVADRIGAPLDVIIVRKLGLPFQPELAMGAIGEGNTRFLNEDVIRLARVTEDQITTVEAAERAELQRRSVLLRGGRPPLDLAGKTAIIVDDGFATGSTARVACQAARKMGAATVIVAVPVAPTDAAERLMGIADGFVTLMSPEPFGAVGNFYEDFTQVTDTEVVELLEKSGPRHPALPAVSREVIIDTNGVYLPGHLDIPENSIGMVLFAHGSGSSRHSPRNRFVAEQLHGAGIGTLLFDLLTKEEEANRSNVFDIELLATRLRSATRWFLSQPESNGCPIGYFGASTGAAAALVAAADSPFPLSAVVSRGGRADLAGSRLGDVAAPTLLIVGGDDPVVLDLNRKAAAKLQCEWRIRIIPGATHLFEEPGTLEEAAAEASAWFAAHLTTPHPAKVGGRGR
jgi:putative phosphoribosyl transferase